MKWVFGIFVSAIFCCVLLLADLRLDHGTFVLKINQSKSKPVQAVSGTRNQSFKECRSVPDHRHHSSLSGLPQLYILKKSPYPVQITAMTLPAAPPLPGSGVWSSNSQSLQHHRCTHSVLVKQTACLVSCYYLVLGGRVLKWAHYLGR